MSGTMQSVSIQIGVSLSSALKFCWVNVSLAPKYLTLSHTVRKLEEEFSVFLNVPMKKSLK
jgi:hypothetical protein